MIFESPETLKTQTNEIYGQNKLLGKEGRGLVGTSRKSSFEKKKGFTKTEF